MLYLFVRLSLGFWTGATRRRASLLALAFLTCLIVNTALALAINRWSKGFFDALQMRDTASIVTSIEQLAALVLATALVAMGTTQARMRLQLAWRLWLTASLVERWVENGTRLDFITLNPVDNPEARIAEDGRIAIDLFVDLAGGIINIVLLSASFIFVLWRVGGSIDVLGMNVRGYLVLAVILYASTTSFAMWLLVRPLVSSVERKAAAEGDFRYALTQSRDALEMSYALEIDGAEPRNFFGFLRRVERKWLKVIAGQTRMISLTSANNLLAPSLPLILGAPKYLAGAMTLGDLMQAATAFLQVQISLNWLADNALTLANWSASARRVMALENAIHKGGETTTLVAPAAAQVQIA